MTAQLVIWGTGGHAREVLELIAAVNRRAPRYEVLGFLDDDAERHGRQVARLPVLGGEAWLRERAAPPLVAIGVGASRARAAVAARVRSAGSSSPVLVHPHASVGQRVELAEGTLIAAGAVITCDVRIEAHAQVNVGASVSHDGRIGTAATIAPGARLTGGVQVGAGCEIGAGAVVLPGCAVGAWAIVGAGAVVLADVEPGTVVAGVPARPLPRPAPPPGRQPA